MGAHLLLNLLNKLRKLGKIGDSALHFIAFSPPKNHYTGAQMLDSIYHISHMAFKLFLNRTFGVKTS